MNITHTVNYLAFGDQYPGINTPLINTPLRQLTSLFPQLDIIVVGIKRGDSVIVPHSEDQMLPGDEAYFVIPSDQCKRAMAAFGHEEPDTRKAIICGRVMCILAINSFR